MCVFGSAHSFTQMLEVLRSLSANGSTHECFSTGNQLIVGNSAGRLASPEFELDEAIARHVVRLREKEIGIHSGHRCERCPNSPEEFRHVESGRYEEFSTGAL